ncbi:hypothetical protein VTI74DRAFT_5801 [Chaetomium olivicolor]
MHFEEGWEEKYSMEKPLYTWLDFFKVGDATLDDLSEKQLRLLAKDLVLLKYKIDFRAKDFDKMVGPNAGFLKGALGMRACESRIIPEYLEKRAKRDMAMLDDLTEEGIRAFLHACIQMKPAKGEYAKGGSFTPPPGKSVKAALRERLTEHNLKFTSGHSIPQLKEMLWRHENGLTVCDNYRDGRAPPDRYRDLDAAISGATIIKQMEATNEELKRTMVHLFKTMEDLRATRLEANFVPKYASLARCSDIDAKVQRRLCESCKGKLRSAEEAFLVVGCGHLLCQKCRFLDRFYCPVPDCPAFICKRPVLRCSEIPRSSESAPRTKAQAVAALIENEIPKTDRVLVFAQYRPLIDALARAFTAAGLTFLNLTTTKDDVIAAKLELFKECKAGQILLLDMDSETSAGANLTVATHVVFASPYVHPDEEHQLRTVRQARGRAIRTGQTRDVTVYHFMVEGTIEEENLRRFGKECQAVREFFEGFGRVPWWLDEEQRPREVNGGEPNEAEMVEVGMMEEEGKEEQEDSDWEY